MRSSCYFEVKGKNIVVDTGPDFRVQALNFGIKRVNAVLYTHTHADHLHGIDDLRPFNFIQRESIPIYADRENMEVITKRFSYIFNPHAYSPGGKPMLVPNVIDGDFTLFGIPIQVIPLKHGKVDTLGFRIGDAAWLTDTKGVYPEGYEKLKGLKVLFLDALRIKSHESHNSLEEALEEAKRIGAEKTVFIHLTHDYDYEVENRKLPEGIELAYDGMEIVLDD